MRKRIAVNLAFALFLLFAMAPTALAQFTPDVFVLDQPLTDGTVTVSRAVINDPGWIVIHADQDGAPGPVIGQAPLEVGINAQVVVEIDESAATETLYAMLHVDEGEAGVYEFPGADVPVLVDGAPVTPSFAVLGETTIGEEEATDEEATDEEATDEEATDEEATDEEATDEEAQADIIDTAAAAGSFETLLAALDATGLTDTLRSEGPFTVFAPTDEAFDALPEGTLEALLQDTDTLTEILLYHVFPGAIRAEDLSDGLEVDTVQGSPATFSVDSDGAMINDANIIDTDIEAANGIIHVIDTVILPPLADEGMADEEEMADEEAADEEAADEEEVEGTAEAADDGTATLPEQDGTMVEPPAESIVDIAMANDQFSVLVAALEATGLTDTLDGDGPFTVFAPTDDAFAGLPEGMLEDLLADTDALTEILLYHVVPGRVFSSDLTDGMEAETAQGEMVTFSITDDAVMVNDANIIVADVLASNGVLHVIDQVLVPPSAAMDDEDATMDDEDAADEDAADEEAADEEMMDDEDAEMDNGTAVMPPTEMPATGANFSSGTATSGVVVLVLLALSAVAYVERRQRNR